MCVISAMDHSLLPSGLHGNRMAYLQKKVIERYCKDNEAFRGGYFGSGEDLENTKAPVKQLCEEKTQWTE